MSLTERVVGFVGHPISTMVRAPEERFVFAIDLKWYLGFPLRYFRLESNEPAQPRPR